MNVPRLLVASIALLSLAAASVLADAVLAPVNVAVPPGKPANFVLIITNDGAAPLRVEVPKSLKASMQAGSFTSEKVALEMVEGGFGVQTVAPGGHLRAVYALVPPPDAGGPVVLEPDLPGCSPVMFSVVPERIAEAAQSSPPPAGAADKASSARREVALRRSTRILSGVSANEPVYFGIGASDGLNAKFQLSLKYNPFDLWPLYLGYTQTSLWDLHSTSKPFRDTAYRPSAFYQNENVWVAPDGRFRFGWQGGLEHESNGKGGVDSRSINIGFVRPRFEWRFHGGNRLVISPKFYGYIEKSENPDIADYRGYGDFLVAYFWHDWRLSVIGRKGMRGHYGSLQVDAVFPLRTTEDLLSRVGVRGVNGYLFLQYFNGWGESILDYNRKLHSQIRGGLMIVP